jgi:uncharacterized membrane protein YgdD (TMEM256/DUF423 family)
VVSIHRHSTWCTTVPKCRAAARGIAALRTMGTRGGRLADLAGSAFAPSIVLFCSAVYALALGGTRLGPLAPIGEYGLWRGGVVCSCRRCCRTRGGNAMVAG